MLTMACAAFALAAAQAGEVEMYVPEGSGDFVEAFRLAPAIRAGDRLYLSGVVTALPQDPAERTPDAYEAAIRFAFRNVEAVLAEAGADWSDVVEMTSFHVDMREHQDIFVRVREEFVTAPPYPAWTAIGVERLWTDELFLEIRVTAYVPTED